MTASPKSSASALKPRRKRGDAGEPRLSRTRSPDGLSAENWQTRLRREFGREQTFVLEQLGADPVFSEIAVVNPASGGRYRVAIRGTSPGENFCSCPDFATNDLGTCKHVEFTLARLQARRGGKAALARGSLPSYSEIYLHYAGERRLCFRAGTECPQTLARQGRKLFDGGAAARAGRSLIGDEMGLVETLAQCGGEVSSEHVAWIERDPVSVRDCLKLPVPPQTVQRLADALGGLLAGLPRG